jgi:hypothetical protein
MIKKITFRKGLDSNRPTLAVGEPGFSTDTKKLYVGSSSGNILINQVTSSDVSSSINTALTGYATEDYVDGAIESTQPVLLHNLEALNPTGSNTFFTSLYGDYNLDSSYKMFLLHYEIKACSTNYGCFDIATTPLNFLLLNGVYSTARYPQATGDGNATSLPGIKFSINGPVLSITDIYLSLGAGNSESFVKIKIYGIK